MLTIAGGILLAILVIVCWPVIWRLVFGLLAVAVPVGILVLFVMAKWSALPQ